MTIKRYPNGELVGYCEGPLRHHMELRGIGIINVQDLFGLAAVRERKPIDLVIELEHWETGQAYDRLGLDETVYHILDTPCPYIRMPVALGRNVASWSRSRPATTCSSSRGTTRRASSPASSRSSSSATAAT